MSYPRSTTDHLSLKRYVVAGDRAYLIGAADGSFPPLGGHIRGKMGGLWAPPIKLLDSYAFSLNGHSLPPTTQLTVHPSHIQLQFPSIGSLEVTRTEFAPDSLPAVLVGLTLRNTGSQLQTLCLVLMVRSQLMAVYPWTSSRLQTAEAFDGQDEGAYDPATGTLVFKETGKPWYALVSANVRPETGSVDDLCVGTQAETTGENSGICGQLEWSLTLPGQAQTTLWCAVAGSHLSLAQANTVLRTALADPARLLNEKMLARQSLLERTRVTLPDPQLQAAFDAAKLNLADLRRTVTHLQIRDVNGGQSYPVPVITLPQVTGLGSGFPDYPHYFAGEGAGYATYALLVCGQWDTAIAHLRLLRDVSRAINGGTGKVVHEVALDGSVFYGTNSHSGNTDETALFTIAVELAWRWSGDEGFRDEMYAFVQDGLRYITGELDPDGDGYPAGGGGVERPGMGVEKLSVAVYAWQALRALERLAASKSDAETTTWANNKAERFEAGFDRDWWMPEETLYADSLGDHNQPLQQRHWINAIPMEAGLAPPEHALTALKRLESPVFTGAAGLYHTGEGGGADQRGERRVWTLANAVMAVGEANYGRLDQALRYMRYTAEQLDLEMPGALPEVLPSPEYDPFMDLHDRFMFMQAWSAYGVQWPVIHHFLGIRPDVPARHLTIVPHLPPAWPGLSAQNLRVGNSVIAVTAARLGQQHTTTVSAPAGWQLLIGHRLPADAEVQSVVLDRTPVPYSVVNTPEGRAVQVESVTGPTRTLVVMVG